MGEPYVRPTVASINLSASTGRAGLKIGDRVRINGTGLYTGEFATIEKLTTGAIPSAVVRTEAGRTRQVRTIDLEPAAATPPASAAPSAPAEQPAVAQPVLAAPAASAEPEPGDGPEPSEG
ncbi:MAG: hypothetical protein QOE42_2252 [Chloroflexota bacterium]|nr:hypothetical protein [Chloroflexota bacterium]